jgi:maltokinase
VLPVGTMTGEQVTGLAHAMRRRLDAAVATVPELTPYVDGLAAAFDELAELDATVPIQRIHGDYHLGQTLRTVLGWKLVDFEGEPEKPLAERTAPDSPLRDVAGMLRSFDYAAWHLMVTNHPGDDQIAYRASEWADRNRGAFCAGYGRATGRDPREEGVLLRAYETDKAIYEAVYEARNRPAWLPIPLAAVRGLVKRGA